MQNNKKTIILVVAILLILIFGFVGLNLMKSNNKEQRPLDKDSMTNESTSEKTETTMKKPADETTVTGSIFDLIKMGSTSKCTFSSNTDTVSTSGTTYISGKQLRGDFDVVTDGNRMESHMYSDGEWVYTWTSALPQGIKMKLDAAESEKMQQDTQQIKGMEDFQNKFDYKCSKWSADPSIFVLPEGVQFTDFSETLKNLKSGSSNMCAACDMVPDATAKEECKARLGCN